jgi:hypothetical protein
MRTRLLRDSAKPYSIHAPLALFTAAYNGFKVSDCVQRYKGGDLVYVHNEFNVLIDLTELWGSDLDYATLNVLTVNAIL